MKILTVDRKTMRFTSGVIGILFAVVMLVGLSACDQRESTDLSQAGQTSPAQTGTMQREVSTLSVSAGESMTVTVTPSNVGGFYAVKDDLDILELVDHTADNYVEGSFIMMEDEPFSYTVEVPQCPAPGHEFSINGEWWTEPGQHHPMPETTLVC